MKIIVKIEKVYGVDRIYPVCDSAQVFAKLIADMQWIKVLGFTVEVQTPSL